MKKPLRIAVGIEIFYPEINGIITTTMNLLHALQELGHEPFIITPRVDEGCGDFEVVENIPVHYIPSKPMKLWGFGPEIYPGLRSIGSAQTKTIASLLQEQRCDIVHITGPWLTCKAMLKMAKKLGLPRVHTFHTNLCDEKYLRYLMPYGGKLVIHVLRRIIWAVISPYIGLSDIVTTPGYNIFKDLQKRFPKSTSMHLPNGIDVVSLQQEDDALLSRIAPEALSRKGRYGVFIGRMGQEKSIDVLLKAVAHVVVRVPDCMFFLIGDGPFIETYRALAQNLGIADKVRFLGKIPSADIKKSGILKHARFFSTPSVTEVQSMTVIEAMCSYVPQVLVDHPSMTDLAQEGALYAKPHDPLALSDAMYAMFTNDAVYETCKKAVKAMSASFDGGEVAKRFLALYDSLL